MTNQEALTAVLQIDVPSNSLVKGLIDADIDPTVGYNPANAKQIDLVAIEMLKGLLSAPSVREGGFAVTYDVDGIKARLTSLGKKHGVDVGLTVTPVVRDRSNLW